MTPLLLSVTGPSFEKVPSYKEGVFKEEQQLIARRPETWEEKARAMVNTTEFPIVVAIVVGIYLLRRR